MSLRLNRDVFFTQGSRHDVCQDFAICGGEERPWVILSDGCSEARRKPTDPVLTDVGARILALASIPYIHHDHFSKDTFCHSALAASHSHARALGLTVDAISATLLTAVVLPDGFFKCRVIGDGNIIARMRGTGTLVWHEIRFLPGGERQKAAPYYLRYEVDQPTKQGWLQAFGGRYRVTRSTLSPDGELKELGADEGTVVPDEVFCYEIQFALEEYDLVALLSDGLSAFTRFTDQAPKEQVSVPASHVAHQLFAYRGNYNGQFVKRRCKRAFDLMRGQELGWQNCDDFSKGAIVGT